jgi:hypothetical protein
LYILNRGEIRIDDEDLDIIFTFLEFLDRNISDIFLDSKREGKIKTSIDCRDVRIWIEDLYTAWTLDISTSNYSSFLFRERKPLDISTFFFYDERLDIEHHVKDRLTDSWKSRIFMGDTCDFDTSDTSSWDGGEHDSTERVSESDSISTRKWLDDETFFCRRNDFSTDFRDPDNVMKNVHRSKGEIKR